MHWDAMLEDGRGELLFGRPIRWMLFTVRRPRRARSRSRRTPAAQSGQVQDVTDPARSPTAIAS